MMGMSSLRDYLQLVLRKIFMVSNAVCLNFFLTEKIKEAVGLTHKMKNIISIKSWNKVIFWKDKKGNEKKEKTY